MPMQKYIGRIVDLIYLDRHGRFSRRRIRVLAVCDGLVRAYDLSRRAPRVFRTENILAALPAVMPA